MRSLAFASLDVFTHQPLEGNPLAVFPDAGELSDPEMLAIAREFNLSETTFVIRRERSIERTRGIRTRIFTTREELPFAGHPTLGTAAILRGLIGGNEITLELNVGTVPIRFTERDHGAFGEMTQIEPTFGRIHDRATVARALGIAVNELDKDLPIQTVSTGNPVAIVPFVRLATLQQWAPDWTRLENYLRGTDARFFYAICREAVAPDAHIHARMIFYGGDDPATGSAAGPAVAWLVRHGAVTPGSPVEIEQGLEIKRPSRLSTRADLVRDRVTNVRVGGYCVPVMRGELCLPDRVARPRVRARSRKSRAAAVG